MKKNIKETINSIKKLAIGGMVGQDFLYNDTLLDPTKTNLNPLTNTLQDSLQSTTQGQIKNEAVYNDPTGSKQSMLDRYKTMSPTELESFKKKLSLFENINPETTYGENIVGGTNPVSNTFTPDYYNKYKLEEAKNAAETEKKNQEEKDKSRQELMDKIINVASGNQDMSVEDSAYMVGQSLGYKPPEGLSDGETSVFKGANLARGISAAGKTLLGGARNVFAGMAFEKKKNKQLQETIDRIRNKNKETNVTQ